MGHAVREIVFLGKTVPVLQEGAEGASPLLALGALPASRAILVTHTH